MGFQLNLNSFDKRMFPIKTNFALCIAGPSGSGKSTFCVDLLNRAGQIFDVEFDKIYWILGDPNAKPKNLITPVEYLLEVPSEFNNESGLPQCYVLDDSMFETQNKSVANLFTRGSHHQNISVIFITQNIFHRGRYSRDISLNFTHLCIMNNPRDRSQFQYLARQLYVECPKELERVYKEVQRPYGYLFIDLTQDTHDLFRFRTDIFNPNYLTVFCPSQLPNEINDEPIRHEVCGEGSAFTASFKGRQI